MRYKFWIVLFLFVCSGVVFYLATGSDLSRENIFVSRVIDGDTFEVGNGDIVRLVGINSPERSMSGWNDAKLFLVSMVLNKSVEFEFREIDKYGRWLGYIFVDGEMVNEVILSNGLGHLYVYEEDEWYDELYAAEEFARINELGIWKKSSLSGCIELVELKYEEGERCNNEERLVLENNCGEDVDIVIKDEATHIYHEVLDVGRNEFSFSCIWNDAGDSVFVWGEDGLILFWRY